MTGTSTLRRECNPCSHSFRCVHLISLVEAIKVSEQWRGGGGEVAGEMLVESNKQVMVESTVMRCVNDK